MRYSPFAFVAAFSLVVLSACTVGGDSSVSKENDQLRRRAIELETKVKSLEGERDELKVKVADLSAATRANLPAEVVAAMPRITKIEIDSLSGLSPANNAVPATAVVVYVQPLDGRGRFTQAVGTLKVEALALAREVGTGKAPTLLASATLSPTQVRDAYRSGLTGTHYEVMMPLASPMARGGEGVSAPATLPTIILRAQFIDAVTGQTLNAERSTARP